MCACCASGEKVISLSPYTGEVTLVYEREFGGLRFEGLDRKVCTSKHRYQFRVKNTGEPMKRLVLVCSLNTEDHRVAQRIIFLAA